MKQTLFFLFFPILVAAQINKETLHLNKADSLSIKKESEKNHSYYLQKGITQVLLALKQPMPDVRLAKDYLGLAAFAKKTDEVEGWLFFCDALLKAEKEVYDQQFSQVQKDFEALAKNSKTPATCSDYVAKRVQLIHQLNATDTAWQRLQTTYSQSNKSSILNFAGQDWGSNTRILTNLPDNAFSAFANATSLHLYGNRLSFLPSSIGDLVQMDSLCVSDNRLLKLPKSIGKLKMLTYLDLGKNLLTEIPSEIGNLSAIKKIDLYSNFLTEIPESIGNLAQLRYLDLRNNKLEMLPATLGNLRILNTLDLQLNQLTMLPKEFTNLENLRFLDLSDNQLLALPSDFGKLVHLELLDLSNNPNLQSLPASIANLKKLKVIYLKGTAIDKEAIQKLLPTCRISVN